MTGFFSKLFNKKPASQSLGQDTIPIIEKKQAETHQGPPADPDITSPEPPQIAVGIGQSVGKQREHNEDSLFTLSTTLISSDSALPFGLFVIADGMGGHLHGEVASSAAIHALAGHVIKTLYLPLFDLNGQQPQDSIREVLQEGVAKAQEAILEKALGGGTTLTAALIIGDQMTIAHVGDSRAYALYPDGRMETLTRDHSLVKRLEELGQITSEEAATHPQRNVLYRAIGQGEPFEPDIISRILGYKKKTKPTEVRLSPRGYRILSRVPRLPLPVIEKIINRFGNLKAVLMAGEDDLVEVEGVGRVRAREIVESLMQLRELSLAEKYSFR